MTETDRRIIYHPLLTVTYAKLQGGMITDPPD